MNQIARALAICLLFLIIPSSLFAQRVQQEPAQRASKVEVKRLLRAHKSGSQLSAAEYDLIKRFFDRSSKKTHLKTPDELKMDTFLSEDFSGEGLPSGWSIVDNAGNDEIWFFENPNEIDFFSTTAFNGFAVFDSDWYDDNEKPEDSDLISPVLDCSAASNVRIEFEHLFEEDGESFAELFVSGDNGESWNSIGLWWEEDTENPELVSIDITEFAAGKSEVLIRWNYKGDWSWWWCIDDVEVFGTQDPLFSTPSTEISFNQKNGPVPVGSPASLFIPIENNGGADLIISSITFNSNEVTSATTNMTIGAGQSDSLEVTWTPSSTGNNTAAVEFTHNAISSPDQINLSLFAVPQNSWVIDFEDDPNSWTQQNGYGFTYNGGNIGATSNNQHWGNQAFWQSGASGNDGNILWSDWVDLADGPAQVSFFHLGASGGDDFVDVLISLDGTTFDVVGTIDNSSNNYQFQSYDLSDFGETIARIGWRYRYADGENSGSSWYMDDLSLPQRSASSPGILSAAPASLDFGTVTVNENATEAVTLTNSGDAVTINSITAGNSDYDISNAPTNVAANGTATFNVTFQPSEEGEISTTVTVDYNNSSGSKNQAVLTISATGNGFQPVPGILSADPTEIDFGEVRVGNSAMEQVELTNVGSAVVITSITTDDDDFTISNDPSTVDENGTATFDVTYAPSETGEASATVTVDYDNSLTKNQVILTIDLNGIGFLPPPGTLSANPESAEFGTVNVGESASEEITLSNTGLGVTITSITSDNEDFTISNAPEAIGEDGSGTFDIDFSPSANGEASATVTVDYNNGPTKNQVELTIDASGNGFQAPPGVLSADPESVDFGDVEVGQSKQEEITLNNTGLGVTITSITSDNEDFSVSGVPEAIDEDGSDKFDVTFAPSAGGEATATLTVDYDNSITKSQVLLTIDLSGTGTLPPPGVLAADPESVEFGTVTVGESTSEEVTLENTGSVVSITSITSDNAAFTISNTPENINEDGSDTFNINFAPSADGEVTATITVDYDNGTSKNQVELTIDASGTGFEPPQGELSANVTEIDFGTVNIGESSSSDVELVNTGPDVTINSITADHSDFSVTNAPGNVNNGQSATFSVNYQPTSEGPLTATLTIDYDEASAQKRAVITVDLSGTGFQPPVGELSASVSDIAFGPVSLGNSANASVELNNTGPDVTINSITVDHPDFSISNAPADVVNGASATFSVNYQPAVEGDASGTVTIDFNETTAKVQLTIAVSGSGFEATAGGFPWLETFETTDFDLDSWDVSQAQGLPQIVDVEGTGGGDYPFDLPSPPYMLRVNASNEMVVTNPFDLSAASDVTFSYWKAENDVERDQHILVSYFANDGTWNTLDSLVGTNNGYGNFEPFALVEHSLPEDAYHADFRIRILTGSNLNARDAYLFDNLSLTGVAVEDTVINPAQNLTAEAGNGVVNLNWSAPASNNGQILKIDGILEEYEIYRSTDNVNYHFVDVVSDQITSYADESVTNGVAYWYYVVAVYDLGNSEPSNIATATPEDNTLYPPANLFATGDDMLVNLNWSAPNGAAKYDQTGMIARGLSVAENPQFGKNGSEDQTNSAELQRYRIYRSLNNLTFDRIDSVNAGTTAYTDLSVTNGMTYFYYITAVYDLGESDASNIDTATPQGAPTNIWFEEKFEELTPPLDWLVIDNDGSGGSWDYRQQLSFTSGDTVFPKIGQGFWHGDFSDANGSLIDEWLISPQILFADFDSLFFYAGAIGGSFEDSLEVLVSTTGNEPANFIHSLGRVKVDGPIGAWHPYHFGMSQFDGYNIHIAIRYYHTDGGSAGSNSDNVWVDHVLLTGVPGEPVSSKNMVVELNGFQEVPPVHSSGYGEGGVFLNTDSTELTYAISLQGLSSNIDAVHFHRSGAGTNGDVVFTLHEGGGLGNNATLTGVWRDEDSQPLTAELVQALCDGEIYVNVHTVDVPSGEIRGQVRQDPFAQMPAPENFTAMPNGGTIDLSWTAPAGGGNPDYNIYRSNDGTAFSLLGSGPQSSYSDNSAVSGALYWYFVTAVYLEGQSAPTDTMSTAITGIETDGGLPGEFVMAQNYPNPFNPTTEIQFALPERATVDLAIYNTLGQKIRTLVSGVRSAGVFTVAWDGKNDLGKPVTSGIYMYKIVSGQHQAIRKMILMK